RRVKVTFDDGSDASAAAAHAKRATVAIVFAADYETEGADRDCLTLECPNAYGDQDSLIQSVASANKRTIVVLETGAPVLTPWRPRHSSRGRPGPVGPRVRPQSCRPSRAWPGSSTATRLSRAPPGTTRTPRSWSTTTSAR
ncbi:MAG: hypothetical protein E6G29_06280, partial [Actinobacteria bacterium]